jgi:hypothetical protein
MENNDSKRSR